MKRVLLALVCACLLAAPAFAQLKPGASFKSDVSGAWRGLYVCGQGLTGLTLDVRDTAPGRIEATFRFGPVPSNPDVPKGAYLMQGTVDRLTREVDLVGVKWIDRPPAFEMVDLHGRLSDLGVYLSGSIPFAGCTEFELIRSDPLIG
jgi:hypothetical protein